MNDLGLGFTLMAIGMVTVFAILLIVIFCGEMMIKAVNGLGSHKCENEAGSKPVDNQTYIVIEAAVAELTGGRGKIESIEKL